MSTYPAAFRRRLLKERRRAFRKHWPLLAAVIFLLCVLSAVLAYLFAGDRQVPAWVLGPVAAVAAVLAARSDFDGTYNLRSGLEAEGWTSRDLRKSLRRGWYVMDWISFGEQGDVDHVVVGPPGVFAVESKYTDSHLDSRTRRAMIASWIAQSQENARRVARLLKHNYGHEVEVRPLVVTSGSQTVKLPAEVEDVDVVRRRNLAKMTSGWQAAPRVFSIEQVESIRAALLDWRGLREDYERDRAA